MDNDFNKKHPVCYGKFESDNPTCLQCLMLGCEKRTIESSKSLPITKDKLIMLMRKAEGEKN